MRRKSIFIQNSWKTDIGNVNKCQNDWDRNIISSISHYNSCVPWNLELRRKRIFIDGSIFKICVDIKSSVSVWLWLMWLSVFCPVRMATQLSMRCPGTASVSLSNCWWRLEPTFMLKTRWFYSGVLNFQPQLWLNMLAISCIPIIILSIVIQRNSSGDKTIVLHSKNYPELLEVEITHSVFYKW